MQSQDSASFRDGAKAPGPEPMNTVVMDSGLVPFGAPRNDEVKEPPR